MGDAAAAAAYQVHAVKSCKQGQLLSTMVLCVLIGKPQRAQVGPGPCVSGPAWIATAGATVGFADRRQADMGRLVTELRTASAVIFQIECVCARDVAGVGTQRVREGDVTEQRNDPVLILVDARNLRRAIVSAALRDWGESKGLALLALSSAQSLAEQSLARQCPMIVLSLGSEPLADDENLQQLKILRVLGEKAALVILSDLDRTDEISLALEAGANGYITTNLDVDIALRALSCVLGGGAFFPTSCLH